MIFLMSGYSGIWAIVRLILVFALILVLAYFAAKFAGKYQNSVLNNRTNIQIVESYRITNNKFLAIAKIGGSYYALGVGKDEITLIDKLDSDKVSEMLEAGKETDINKISFKEILTKMRNSESGDNAKSEPEKPTTDNIEDNK